MAHAIIERPSQFCLSKNEIRYVYQVTDLARAGLYFEIKIIYQDVSDQNSVTTIELPSFKLLPNGDGKVYLYIQQYLDSILLYQLPINNVPYLPATRQYIPFWCNVREVTDDNNSPDWDTAEEANKRFVLKMGIEKHLYSRNNFFANYLTPTKAWLTWLPPNRMVFPDQPLWLSAFFSAGTSAGCNVVANYQTIDGTTGTVTEHLDGYHGYVFHFDVRPVRLGIIAAIGARQLYWFEVGIQDASNTYITNPYRFYIDYNNLYHHHDFIYHNSLGGMDTIRAEGEITYSVDRTYDESEGGFSVNEWNAMVKTAENTQVGINLRKNFKGDIGFRNTKNEQSSLLELLVSTSIYEIIDSRFVPVNQMQKSQQLRVTTDKKWSFPIEWQLAETNEVFTPSHITFGLGEDTENY